MKLFPHGPLPSFSTRVIALSLSVVYAYIGIRTCIQIYMCVGTLVVGTDADVRSAFCRPAAKSFRFNTPFKIRGCRFPGKYVALDGTRNIIYADKCDEI